MVLRSARPRIVLAITAGVALGALSPGVVILGAPALSHPALGDPALGAEAPGVSAAGGVVAGVAEAPQVDAQTALDNAITDLEGVGYNVTGTIGSTAAGGTGSIHAAGSVDPATGAAVVFKGVAGGVPVAIQFVQNTDSLWAKINIPPLQQQLGVGPDQWMQFDESKITNPNNIPFDLSGGGDAINISGLMKATSNVKYPNSSDTKKITGTVDLTQATGVGSPNPNDLSKAGSAAKTTPFTVTLDDRGRLADLKINADGFNGNLTQEIKFTDYGSPTPVTAPPPGNVIPAPPAAYQFFNS